MDVDGIAAPQVHHRRQLMHPGAVIALVVGIVVGAGPAMHHQRVFHVVQLVLRHEDVDVREQAATAGWQAGHRVCSAFEQNQGQAQLGQIAADALDFVAGQAPMTQRDDARRFQVLARLWRHVVEQAVLLEQEDQDGADIGAVGLAQQAVPARQVKQPDPAGRRQHLDQQRWRARRHGVTPARRSNSAIASSSWL